MLYPYSRFSKIKKSDSKNYGAIYIGTKGVIKREETGF